MNQLMNHLIDDLFCTYLPSWCCCCISNFKSIFKTNYDELSNISNVQINSGSFGTIYKSKDNKFVYKKLKNPLSYDSFIKESFLYYYYFVHDIGPEIYNVYYKLSEDRNKYYIILKLKKYDSNLKTYITNNLIYTEFNDFFTKIQHIINNMFDLDIVATDIKYENFLIDTNKNIVLTDFDYDHCFIKTRCSLFKPFVCNDNLFNDNDINNIKKICNLSMFFSLVNYLLTKPYVNSIYNRNVIEFNFVYDYDFNINSNINYLLSESIYNIKFLSLYEYSRHFMINIDKLLPLFGKNNIYFVYTFRGVKIIDNFYELIHNDLISIFIYQIGSSYKIENKLKEGSYGVIHNYFNSNTPNTPKSLTQSTLLPNTPKSLTQSTLTPNTPNTPKSLTQSTLLPNTPKSLTQSTLLPNTPKSSTSLAQKIIKISKLNKSKNTQIYNIEFEYNLYKKFNELGIGIKTHDLKIYENNKYGIIMDKYDGDLKDYFYKNIEIIQLEDKIKHIITIMYNSNYLCADFKFGNLLYKINNTEIDIKLTDFDKYFCIEKPEKNIYQNFDKLLMLTICMQHLFYLCKIDKIYKTKLLLSILKNTPINLQILFINEQYNITDFDFLDNDSIKWIKNLIKYIGIGVCSYEQEAYYKDEYILNNYKNIITEAIEIITNIKKN